MLKVRFGIVGCGKISDRHGDAIKVFEDASLVAVSDLDEERLNDFKVRYNVPKAYNDYSKLLEDPEIDMIVICTPSGLHARMAIQALEHGKHVLCEKPIAMNVEDARKVNALAKEKNLFIFEVKQNRYKEAIQILKKIVDEKLLGKLLIGNTTVRWNRTNEYYKQAPWFGTIAMDGGVVLNQAIHHIDLLRWIMGPAKSVMAKTRVLNHDIEAPDTALAIIEFENGAVGNMELTTCAAPTNIEGSITIMGDKGTIKVGGKNLNTFEIWNVEGYEKPEIPESKLSDHAKLYQEILNVMSGQSIQNLTTGEDGLESLKLAENIFLSSNTNKEVLI